jgi:hypothetical protein
VLCMFGWIFRGRATALATALFGPWLYSSFVWRSLCPSSRQHRSGRRLEMGALVNIVHNIRRGSSSPPSGRHGCSSTTEPDLPHLLRLGMGGPTALQHFHPNYGFVPVAATPVLDQAWWRQRRCEWSQLPKAEVVLAVSLVLYGSGFFSAVTQHKQSASISIRSCCPWRWWAQVTASIDALLTRRQLESVLAGGNGDGGIQL